MPHVAHRAAGLVVALALLGCRESPPKSESAEKAPAASVSANATVHPPAELPRRLAPPAPIALAAPARIGLPEGCRWKLPMRRLDLPSGVARFVSPRWQEPRRLAAAVDTNRDGKVDRAGSIPLGGGATRSLPWLELDTPPPLAATNDGWLAVLSRPATGALRTLSIWSDDEALAPLATADRLEATDAQCSGARCAVLSTVATKAGGSGATIFWTDAFGKTPFARADVRPESGGPWAPYSLVTLEQKLRIAVTSPKALEVWAVAGSRPERVARFDIEHALYDVLYADEPMALVAAESLPVGCGPVRLATLRSGSAETFELPATPESLVARPLSTGFVVAWIGPRSCTLESQPMVYGALLDRQGRFLGSPMAMADAAGFSVSAHGDTVDWFLSVGPDLVWATAECRTSESR